MQEKIDDYLRFGVRDGLLRTADPEWIVPLTEVLGQSA